MLSGQLQGTLSSPIGKPPVKAVKTPLPKVAGPAAAAAPAPATRAGQGPAGVGPQNASPGLVESKSYDVATDESCASVAFVWSDGKREVGLPYVQLSRWSRSESDLTLVFGEIEVRLRFDPDFPLSSLLMNFRFQRVATIYEIPGLVKMSVVKIDPESGAASPL